ncbi:MAG: hypothetical protein E7480_06560 [Ruminococcaceae bacterium]|nr:hypothetical protein [Oscillospiraceae bacterium]
MDDFSSKISELLSNPESFEKIKLIAESLSSDTNTETSFQNDASEPIVDKQAQPNNEQSIFSSIDPQILLKIGSVLSQTNPENDKNIKLMNSIKPYLSQKRAAKMDTALQMFKLGKYATAFLKDTDLFKKQEK